MGARYPHRCRRRTRARSAADHEPDQEIIAESAKEAAKPAPTKSAATPRKAGPRRWNEDARHCLERTSNTEVIKCAEEYL